MPGHGSAPPRGLASTSQSSIETGKFGRMFGPLAAGFQPSTPQEELEVHALLRRLAALMVSDDFDQRIDAGGASTPDADLETPEPERENRSVPAGYTYFGQFVDHDVTFDPASSLQRDDDPSALEDYRTPRLDLDSLYGRGPADQPYLYERQDCVKSGVKSRGEFRAKFRLGPDRGVDGQVRPDLPRTDDGTALIADDRNDDNKIVRQIHALFLRLHNKLFDALGPRFAGADSQEPRFREAQRIARWCYQWLILHDFLPRLCGSEVVARVMPAPGTRPPRLELYAAPSGRAFIPVELAAAAYRFGHAMVRPSYALNGVARSPAQFRSRGGKTAPFARIPIFVPRSDDARDARDALDGSGEPLPESWGIDWAFFFGQAPPGKPGIRQLPQPSYRIDTSLVDPLGRLPELSVPAVPSPFASLALRNLQRGFRLKLPAGQAVARLMGEKPLSDEQLWQSRAAGNAIVPWSDGEALFADNERWLAGRAPLWFYILKEAELTQRGERLGAVGGRIVAETLVALVWLDRFSYLYQAPGWDPSVEQLPGLDAVVDLLGLTKYVG